MPTEICTYIKSTYSQLTASVSTRNWRTNTFSISQGIFQGDTLSPLIFLLAFNPIINLVKSLTSGYQIQIALPGRISAKGKFIYLEWNEPQSSEPPSWYLCKIVDHTPNGLSEVQYNKDTFERVNLNTCTWRYAKGNGKKFLPPHCPLPEYTPKESDSPPYCLSHPHKAKSFANDLTILSSNPTEHQYALSELDQKCNDLGLSIRPDKCVSLALHEGSVTKKGFNIGVSQPTNLCDKPAKFLGSTIAVSSLQAKKKASSDLLSKVTSALSSIDKRPIRGEYKLWIYKQYLVPSLRFVLSVNAINQTTLLNIQRRATRYIKSWLNLPRCCTLAPIFHPDILNVPQIKHQYAKAKVQILASVTRTDDPLIRELAPTALSNLTEGPLGIPQLSHTALEAARSSVSRLRDIPKAASTHIRTIAEEELDAHTMTLTVQNKIADIISLEKEEKLWRRILSGLPSGQLSFLLRAGCDCLPSPINLRRWKIITESKCALCSSPNPTSNHILSCCPSALEQGRYTWRHDSTLLAIVSGIKVALASQSTHHQVYADLPGWRVTDNPPSTVPSWLTSTLLRPDLVIISNESERILELTVPQNSVEGLHKAKLRKSEKYDHIIGDIQASHPNLRLKYHTLEMGTLGHYSRTTRDAVQVVSHNNKLAQMILEKAAKTAITCTQNIFWARSNSTWDKDRALLKISSLTPLSDSRYLQSN